MTMTPPRYKFNISGSGDDSRSSNDSHDDDDEENVVHGHFAQKEVLAPEARPAKRSDNMKPLSLNRNIDRMRRGASPARPERVVPSTPAATMLPRQRSRCPSPCSPRPRIAPGSPCASPGARRAFSPCGRCVSNGPIVANVSTPLASPRRSADRGDFVGPPPVVQVPMAQPLAAQPLAVQSLGVQPPAAQPPAGQASGPMPTWVLPRWMAVSQTAADAAAADAAAADVDAVLPEAVGMFHHVISASAVSTPAGMAPVSTPGGLASRSLSPGRISEVGSFRVRSHSPAVSPPGSLSLAPPSDTGSTYVPASSSRLLSRPRCAGAGSEVPAQEAGPSLRAMVPAASGSTPPSSLPPRSGAAAAGAGATRGSAGPAGLGADLPDRRLRVAPPAGWNVRENGGHAPSPTFREARKTAPPVHMRSASPPAAVRSGSPITAVRSASPAPHGSVSGSLHAAMHRSMSPSRSCAPSHNCHGFFTPALPYPTGGLPANRTGELPTLHTGSVSAMGRRPGEESVARPRVVSFTWPTGHSAADNQPRTVAPCRSVPQLAAPCSAASGVRDCRFTPTTPFCPNPYVDPRAASPAAPATGCRGSSPAASRATPMRDAMPPTCIQASAAVADRRVGSPLPFRDGTGNQRAGSPPQQTTRIMEATPTSQVSTLQTAGRICPQPYFVRAADLESAQPFAVSAGNAAGGAASPAPFCAPVHRAENPTTADRAALPVGFADSGACLTHAFRAPPVTSTASPRRHGSISELAGPCGVASPPTGATVHVVSVTRNPSPRHPSPGPVVMSARPPVGWKQVAA